LFARLSRMANPGRCESSSPYATYYNLGRASAAKLIINLLIGKDGRNFDLYQELQRDMHHLGESDEQRQNSAERLNKGLDEDEFRGHDKERT